MPNLLEEALGSDPSDAESTYSPLVDTVDDGTSESFFSVNYTVNKSVDIDVVLEESTDLTNWTPVDLSNVTVNNVDNGDFIETTVYMPAGEGEKLFRITASN